MEQNDIQKKIIRQSCLKCATEWCSTVKQCGETITDEDIKTIAEGFEKWVNRKEEVKIDLQ